MDIAEYRKADGRLNRRTISSGMFQLQGFDPRVPPPFQHSTTAAITRFQSTDDTPLVAAVDAVTRAFFNGSGIWTVELAVADLADTVFYDAGARITSWVLCYEPSPDPNLPKGGPSIPRTGARSFAPSTFDRQIEQEMRAAIRQLASSEPKLD
ncbi:hypothetical protein WDZ92_24145 [Nostoc sp. NIES-2111]